MTRAAQKELSDDARVNGWFTNPFYAGNNVEPPIDGAQTYQRMKETMETAREQTHFIYFDWIF